MASATVVIPEAHRAIIDRIKSMIPDLLVSKQASFNYGAVPHVRTVSKLTLVHPKKKITEVPLASLFDEAGFYINQASHFVCYVTDGKVGFTLDYRFELNQIHVCIS